MEMKNKAKITFEGVSINEYVELVEFRRKTIAGYTSKTIYNYCGDTVTFMTKDEATKEMINEIDKLKKIVSEKERELVSIRNELKEMNCGQFRKWKRVTITKNVNNER